MSLKYGVLEEAAQWFAILHSERASDAERLAWKAWVKLPEHAAAWQRVERISLQLQPVASTDIGRTAGAVLQRPQPNRRQALKMLSLLCGAGALAVATGAAPWREWVADLRTDVGEIRDLYLADGSRLWLNTDSAVNIDVDRQARALSLQRGEVLVEVAAGERPFSITSGGGRLFTREQARFSVCQCDGATRLSVYSGTVGVHLDALGETRRILSGRQVVFSDRRMGPEQPVQAASQAWASGVLLADNLRLEDFLAELSRYRHGYLGCDPKIADLRVVGAFPLADTDRVIEAVASTLSLRINRRLPWWVSLESARSSGKA